MFKTRLISAQVRRMVPGAIVALAITAFGAPAGASDLNVQPLKLHLKSNRTSDTITVENRGTAMIRLQVSGFAWDQDATGAPKYEATRDLVFFPVLLTIDPGKKKSVRVGLMNTTPTSTEKTFRVFFEELPSLASQIVPETTGLTILSKFGIPVFLDPVKIAPKPEVSVKGVKNGVLMVAAANAGNAHYMSTSVGIAGLDARGSRIFDRSEKGWYVLAHGEREYALQLDPKECASLHDVTIDLKTTAGNMKQTLAVAPGSCGK
jgi:fimbrial chaperone protein